LNFTACQKSLSFHNRHFATLPTFFFHFDFVRLNSGLRPTNKKPMKIIRILAKFQNSENSTDFSSCVPIKYSEEKSSEI
jgi:hypothetical protein